MLTQENLNGVEGLTPEQITAITTLSKNDEEAVIGAKIGEIYGNLEKDVTEVTGLEKNKGEKAYSFLKRVLGDFKTGSETSKSTLTELQGKYDKLVEESKNKADAGSLQQIADLKSQLEAVTAQHNSDKELFEREKAELGGKLQNMRLDGAFDKALTSLKFKDGYPEDAIKRNVEAAKFGILNKYKTEFDQDGTLKFRDADGNIVKDKANAINPATLDQMLTESLGYMLADKAKGGAGGHGGKPETEVVDLAGARTQVEADACIKKQLLAKGLTTTSVEYRKAATELRTAAGVDKLPIR